MKSQYLVEPTNENLELYQRVNSGIVYWHTSDFFLYDEALESYFSDIFDVYMDALIESEEDDDERFTRRISFKIGRLIVKAAKEVGISPKDFRDQFANYTTVIWTPICIWRKDSLGKVGYSLMSNLPSN